MAAGGRYADERRFLRALGSVRKGAATELHGVGYEAHGSSPFEAEADAVRPGTHHAPLPPGALQFAAELEELIAKLRIVSQHRLLPLSAFVHIA